MHIAGEAIWLAHYGLLLLASCYKSAEASGPLPFKLVLNTMLMARSSVISQEQPIFLVMAKSHVNQLVDLDYMNLSGRT